MMLHLTALLACTPRADLEPQDLVALVDPFVGTGGDGFGYGGLSPAAGVPGGLVKVGPDTDLNGINLSFNHSAGYWYNDTHLQALSHHRLPGIGVSDGGALGLMITDMETVDPDLYRVALDHSLEEASPGWYAVTLPERGRLAMSAAAHSAHHELRWSTDEQWLVLDLAHTTSSSHSVSDSWVVVDPQAQEVRGYVLMDGSLTRGFPLWFVMQFSQPWLEANLWQDRAALPAGSLGPIHGPDLALTFRTAGNLELRVGFSAVDLAGARANLEAELPHWGVSTTRELAEDAWRGAFEAVEVLDIPDPTDLALFATALYNTLTMPTQLSDVDGRYRGVDGQPDLAVGWTYSSDLSLWDTYRTLHPWVTLVWPERAEDYARSLTDMGRKLGYLPRWPAGVRESGTMIGTPAEIVLAETWIKGVRDWPYEDALAVALPRATDPTSPHAREGLAYTQSLGYLPADLFNTSASKTLEFATSDAAMGLWTAALGLEAESTQLFAQAQGWVELFHPDTQFIQGRNQDGSWPEVDPEVWDDMYSEGNSWQYTWMVPQDPELLAATFGGADAALDKLEECFERAADEEDTLLPDTFYWHGNEPDLVYAWLFAALGRPESTQRWVRWVQDTKYALDPVGLDGNDDGGTLSAWLLFSMLGLYPLNGTDQYVLSTPRVNHVVLRREGGALTVRAEGEGDYLEGVWLDGELLDSAVIRHAQLVGDRELLFRRSATPTDWGAW